jgi:5'-nucleotidase
VTYARLTAVEPAGADLMRVTLTGAQVRQLLEEAVADIVPRVHLAGVTARYDPRARPGRRLKGITLLGGRKLRPQDTYTVATDDSTAAGAGGFTVLPGKPVERRGLLDIEAVAGYLRRLPQPVEAEAAATLVSTRR